MKEKIKLFLPILILSSLFLYGCFDTPGDFYAPKYDINIDIPITERAYLLQEAIEKDTAFVRYNYNPTFPRRLYYVDNSITIDPVTVGDNLKVDDLSTSFSQTIGTIKINDPAPVTAEILVEQWSNATTGSLMIFPQSQGDPSVQFEQIDAFEEVSLSGGFLTFTITNRLPVAIEMRGFSVTNVVTQTTVADTNAIFPIAENGGSVDIQFWIGGKTITNQLQFDGTLRTDGSLTPVQIPNDAGTVVTTTFSDLVLESARAPLPEQDPFTKDSTFVIDDSTFIQQANFNAGNFQIKFTNNFDMDIRTEITLNNMFDSNGNPFTANVNIPRGEERYVPSDPDNPQSIAGWSIQSLSGNPENTLSYSVLVNTESTTDPRQIATTDSIGIDVNMSGLVFESVSGIIKPTFFALDPTSFAFDLGDLEETFEFGVINFDNPEILLTLNSSANIDLDLSANVTGTSSTQTESIALNNIGIAGGASTQIKLSDYGLKNLINSFTGSFPNTFTIDGDALINPNFVQGSVTRNDSITGNVGIEIPLNLAIEGGEVIDTVEIDFGEVDEDEIAKVNFGQLTIEMENEVPIDIIFQADVINEFGAVVLTLPVPARSPALTVPAPTVDSEGEVVSAGTVTQVIDLFQDEIQELLNNEKMIIRIELATPPLGSPQPVKFRTSDEIRLKLYASASYKIDFD
ncbi:MAG: hypothetical protein SCALA702_15210 [Melioribacteraceae bacterium]|nr:MAG: hypothetical protein SCALA702_15210 [Melioribacteraceae bacterium]